MHIQNLKRNVIVTSKQKRYLNTAQLYSLARISNSQLPTDIKEHSENIGINELYMH